MELKDKDSKINIKIAQDESVINLNIIAEEFLELIDDFNINFINNKYLILTAYFNNNLAGILIAENKIHKIDSLEKIIPKVSLYLIYVNATFRNNHIGKKLLNCFLKIQKSKGVASVYIELPQKYIRGIEFFKRNNFLQMGKDKNKIILEINLWNDYGIRDDDIIENSFNDLFN